MKNRILAAGAAAAGLCSAAGATIISDFSVFGVNSVVVGEGSDILSGLVGAGHSVLIGSGGHVAQDIHSGGTVTTHTAHIDGNIFAAGSVSLGPGADVGLLPGSGNIDTGGNMVFAGWNPSVLGHITYAGTFSHPDSGTFGSASQGIPIPPSLPLFPTASAFSAGGASFTTNNGVTTTLAPGSYGNIHLGGGNTLNLTAGDYFFSSLVTNNGPELNLDLTDGPINIFAVGNISFGAGLDVHLTGGDATDVYVETHGSFTKAGGGNWFGTVFAPFGTIHVGSGQGHTEFAGAMWGLDVDIEHVVDVHHDPVPGPATLALLALGMLMPRRRRARWA